MQNRMSRHSSSDSGLKQPLSKGEKNLKFSFEMKDMSFRRMEDDESAMIHEQGEQIQDQEEYSDEESDKEHEKEVRKELRDVEMKQNQNKKMVVGTGFSMDVTQFFQFGKRKELGSKVEGDKSIFEEISGSRLAWLILLWSVTTGAIIPGWIMNIPANKVLRISWRFVMQVPMMIPFVLYEYRTASPQVRQQYQLSYIFKPSNFIKPLASSLANSFWFTMIMFGFEWTLVSHSIVLGSLSNFFLSITRSSRNSSHDLELGGQMLVVLGVVMVIIDTLRFDPAYLTPHDYDVNNTFYFNRAWWERLTFDLSAFCVSFIMSRFSQYTSDLKNYYPPFLSMLMVNTFNAIHMAFSSFFFHGCNFDFDSFWGIWSIFSDKHFAGFLYMAIILFMGQMISIMMITKMFPDPIVPALAMTLEPFIATLFLDLTGIQRLPDSFTLIGYLFLVPGLCLILVGQCLYQRINAKEKQDNERKARLQTELQQILQRKREREIRSQQKARVALIHVNSRSDDRELFSQ